MKKEIKTRPLTGAAFLAKQKRALKAYEKILNIISYLLSQSHGLAEYNEIIAESRYKIFEEALKLLAFRLPNCEVGVFQRRAHLKYNKEWS